MCNRKEEKTNELNAERDHIIWHLNIITQNSDMTLTFQASKLNEEFHRSIICKTSKILPSSVFLLDRLDTKKNPFLCIPTQYCYTFLLLFHILFINPLLMSTISTILIRWLWIVSFLFWCPLLGEILDPPLNSDQNCTQNSARGCIIRCLRGAGVLSLSRGCRSLGSEHHEQSS